ncbi:MAG TPA: DNA ligase D [Woeseiaceae bacterium]|nr:DNA ligase D [Woeseiaceae bacterium]
MARSDRLAEYAGKRDFTKTQEPAPAKRRPGRGRGARRALGFFVQKHDARRLHWDLRLEWDGVLLSWAVTRGPSPDPSQKRLAVRTEDHPLSYAEFEGTIPKKEYGGGTVMLWDRGTWEPGDGIDDVDKALENGKLRFVAHGERMRAGWILVRMRRRPQEKRENWLLIKEHDEEANDDPEALVEHYTKSIATARSMPRIALEEGEGAQAAKPAARRKGGARAKASKRGARPPPFQQPQLATLTEDVPAGSNWLHEMKFDGYRCLVAVGGGNAICYTRSGLDWTAKFGEVAGALAGLDCASALLDGEIVASAGDGGSDFSALQSALSEGKPTEYYAFDLLHLDGDDLRSLPLVERKERLRALLAFLPAAAPVHFSEHVQGHGRQVFEEMCRSGKEGIIAKKADAPYSNRRTRTWLKIKCRNRQEFVIGGYKRSDKRGRPFSSLLLGAYEGDELVYRGKVGTGYSEAVMDDLAGKLEKLRRKDSPFDRIGAAAARGAVWVSPRLVAEIDYSELTGGGQIRHGSFIGLREDKAPAEVTMENASNPPREIGNELHGVRLTNADRVLYREQGVTKADLVRYYDAIAKRMLPLMERHPLSLVRCPKGTGDKCFFQKHASGGFPEALKEVPIRESSGKEEEYLYVDDVAGLIAGVQMGTLEFHIWGSRIDKLEKPDRVVFDLDPDEALDFEVVKLASMVVRDRLAKLGLETLPLVTGGKGIHVVAPLRRSADWPRIKAFTKGFATTLAGEHPDVFTATMSKSRRHGRIFLDWLRNERGSTAIAPYSTRAKKGAPVAMPVSWKELRDLEAANSFGLEEAKRRLARPDPWAAYGDLRQSITKKMHDAVL